MKIETKYRYARRDIRKLKRQLVRNVRWLDLIAMQADRGEYYEPKSIRLCARETAALLRSIR